MKQLISRCSCSCFVLICFNLKPVPFPPRILYQVLMVISYNCAIPAKPCLPVFSINSIDIYRINYINKI